MTQQPTTAAPRPGVPTPGYWPPSRILLVIAAACFLIAALLAAGVFDFSPASAWVLGGVCAVILSWAVP